MVDIPCGHCEGSLWRSIAETEGINPGQQLHILGERLPATGIVLCGSPTVGMYTPGLEDDIWIVADILLLLYTRAAIGDTEGVGGWQHLHAGRGRAVPESIPAAGVIFGCSH